MKKKWALAVFILIVTLLLSSAGFVSHAPYVVDDAGLFGGSQLQDLEGRASALSAQLKMDVVIVTADDTGGQTSTQYSNDFFEYNGYGQGNDYDGVLFLIDMDNRELAIATSGVAIRYFTDDRIELMLDNVFVYTPSDDYYSAALAFLDAVSYWHAQGIPDDQHNVDEEGNVDYYRSITPQEAALAGGAALATGGAFFGITAYRYRVGAKLSGFDSADNTRYKLTDQQDTLVNKTVTTRHIPRDTGDDFRGGGGTTGGGSSGRSSTHTSSSGRTFGGSSRKF